MPDKPPAYFPAFLNLAGKPCLVVGGGPIALGKAKGLLKCGARVTAVAKFFVPAFSTLRGARLKKRPFSAQDLAPAPWLVVAATDDDVLNEKIFKLCRARRVWANVVDVTPLCDFIYPAVVRRGAVTLAISTGGRSPAIAKFLRRRLEKSVGREVATMARALARSRGRLKKLGMAARKRFLARVVTPAWLARVKKEGAAPLMRHIKRSIP